MPLGALVSIAEQRDVGHYALVSEQRAEVVDIAGLEWDGGAPLPVLIATDYRTLFACYLPTEDDRVVVA